MPTENAKEFKYVLLFLSFLSMIVLGSFIIDRDPIDILYLLFIVSCIIRYYVICLKS